MASHLNFYTGVSGMFEVDLLNTMWCIAIHKKHRVYADLLNAHRDSVLLWTNIFSLVRTKAISDEERSPHTGSNEDFIGIVPPLTRHTANTLQHYNHTRSENECADLVAHWVASDFFRTLDQ